MDRFDIVLGYYVFLNQNHSGQSSDFYKRLCHITKYFNPGAAFSETRFFDLCVKDYEGAREVYQRLCEKHGIGNPFRTLIAVDRDEAYAPGCYLVCRVKNPTAGHGHYDWDTSDEENTVLIQTGWDFPGVARAFGWSGDDSHITAAAEYLDTCVEKGKVIEDPGYFDTEGECDGP